MVATYLLIIMIAVTFICIYTITATRKHLIEQKEMQALTQANMVSNYISRYKDLSEESISFLLQKMLQLPNDSRLIRLDTDARVIFDSKETLKGKILTEPLAFKALSGSSDTDYTRESSGGSVVNASVSITEDKRVTGAVFIQFGVSDIDNYVEDMAKKMLLFALFFVLLAIVICHFFSSVVTRPIETLTHQLESAIESEEDDITLPSAGGGEIGKLVESFNKMTEKIRQQEEKRQEFVSNASHELKTPLSAIKLISDSLIQTPDAPKEMVDEFLNDMNVEVDRLTRIVNKLLTLTKMDSSVSVMRMEFLVMDFSDVIANAIKALRPLADSKNIELTYESEGPIYFKIERDRLWEAVYNLIDNSIKYTHEGGHVEVTLTKEDNTAKLTVKDSGIGIAQEEQYKIFDRFYRVDKARARETGGTGLGLSITLSAVELHGGSIQVESEEGVGTCFTVSIPITLK